MELQNNTNPLTDTTPASEDNLSVLDRLKKQAATRQSTGKQMGLSAALGGGGEGKAFRLTKVKYQLYIALLFVLGYILWVGYIDPQWSASADADNALAAKQTELDGINAQIKTQQDYATIVDAITAQHDALVACVATHTGCDTLSDVIQQHLTGAKNYIEADTLDRAKMTIDEKKIIANMDLYLLRDNDSSEAIKPYIATLSNITMDEPVQVEGDLRKVPVSVTATFANKDKLLVFIKNIQSGYFAPAPILYYIDQIDYNLMQYDESQSVNILLDAYYYKSH